MKIQCDVCTNNYASFFCTADEAALCDGCDHRVHHANKLASKHLRFSLRQISANHSPLCDVCQERRGLVFCQQDRAILCKECDLPIHSANDHTMNHSRFLLTGIKLSAAASPAALQPPPLPLADNVSASVAPAPLTVSNNSRIGGSMVVVSNGEEGEDFTSSSISEYLTKTIPGWQFEDFLDSPSIPFAFSKNGDHDVLYGGDGGDIIEDSVSLTVKSMGGKWVPQAPYSVQMNLQTKECSYSSSNISNLKGSNRSRLMERRDDNFIVPQMSPASSNIATKRSRLLW